MPIITPSTASALLVNKIPRRKPTMARSGRRRPAMNSRKPMNSRKNRKSGRRK